MKMINHLVETNLYVPLYSSRVLNLKRHDTENVFCKQDCLQISKEQHINFRPQVHEWRKQAFKYLKFYFTNDNSATCQKT